MAEVEAFMSQFTDENIELIWGYSKDNSLEDGQVKVTVLATGFGMKNIPGMEPIVSDMKQEAQALTDQERIKKEKEEQKLNDLLGTFYKPDYKMYVFKGEEMYNDEFLAALDNSPTYKRTAQELECMVSIFGNEVQEISTPTANESTENNVVTEEDNGDNDDENIGQTVFSKEFN